MTDREILFKAYEKAYGDNFATEVFEHDVIDYCGDGSLNEDQYLRDIFSHDFAKAFWGEIAIGLPVTSIHFPGITFEIIEVLDETSVRTNWKDENPNGQLISDLHWNQPAWAYHLQQMVLVTDRLRYIERFL